MHSPTTDDDYQPASFADLLDALQSHRSSAACWLERVSRATLQRLAGELNARGAIDEGEHSQFVPRALVWVRLYLITLPKRRRLDVAKRGALTAVVCSLVAVAVGRHFGQPPPRQLPSSKTKRPREGSLHLASGHVAQWLDWPAREVSGDFLVFGDRAAPSWIVLGDVCGKGWLAHCVAEAIRLLTPRLTTNGSPDPADLLQRLSDEIERILPQGLFVAAAAVLLTSDGAARVAVASISPLVLRSGPEQTIKLVELSGIPLALGFLEIPPPRFDACSFELQPGDELLVMSDGVCDQDTASGKLLAEFPALTKGPISASESLRQRFREALARSLAEQSQFDDITLLSIERRDSHTLAQSKPCQQCPADACPELVERVLLNDASATADLVSLLRQRFEPTIKRMLNHHDDVDDAFQAALARFFTQLHRWRRDCPLCLFFRVIVIREAINILRARQRRRETSPETLEVVDHSLPATSFARSQLPNPIESVLASVSPEIADCLRLKILQSPPRWRLIAGEMSRGASRREIAEQLSLTPQAIGLYVRKMHAWLAACWEK